MVRQRRREEEEPEPVGIEYERVVHETDAAFLFLVPTYGTNMQEVWIPKSQIQHHDEDEKLVTVPEWLATKKGLT